MKTSLLFFLSLFFFNLSGSFAQVGESFPTIAGTNLNDESISLPQAAKGKPVLVVLAYSEKSQEDLETWIKPIYQRLIHEDKTVFKDMYESYDVEVFFVPMIRGINKTAYNKIEKEMKANMEDEYKPYVMLYKGSISDYKRILSLNSKNEPYFYLVNQKGKIVYATSGAYSIDKMTELENKLELCYKK